MGLCGSAPKTPDPADAYTAGQLSGMETFPLTHDIEAAAKLGQKITVTLPGGKQQTLDFTGLGDAQFQGEYSDKMAAQLLQLQKDLGPAFVQQRLAELQAADPQGQGIRQHLFDRINQDLADSATADQTTANTLQQSILDELNKGGRLDPGVGHAVSQGVLGGQVARGNYLGNAAAMEEAGALTKASEDTAAQRKASALAFLTSGATPDDVSYRRAEQALSNLGSFAAGESPVAQFGQLSGAANGVVPFETGSPLAGLNPNAGAQGVSYANQSYATQAALNNSQVNPWLAGLSGAASGAGLGAAWAEQ